MPIDVASTPQVCVIWLQHGAAEPNAIIGQSGATGSGGVQTPLIK